MTDSDVSGVDVFRPPNDELTRLELRRSRLYDTYATHHAGITDGRAASWIFRRDILPHLPADSAAAVLDIGCGQGFLVEQCHGHGYRNAAGVDVSEEQVAIARGRGVTAVSRSGAIDALRAATNGGGLDAVIATDVLEHLTKDEVLDLLDFVYGALRPGGRLIARTPNALNPFFGYYQYGDFSHETVFTARSMAQVTRSAGFSSTRVLPCGPVVHSLASGVRHGLWMVTSGLRRVVLAAETGRLRGHILTMNLVVVAGR